MKDRVFLDTNILIYLYSEDEIEKQETEDKCDKLYSEDMQHGQIIEGRLKTINPYVMKP